MPTIYTVDEKRMRINRYKSWVKSMSDQEQKRQAIERFAMTVLYNLQEAGFKPTTKLSYQGYISPPGQDEAWQLYDTVYLLTDGRVYDARNHDTDYQLGSDVENHAYEGLTDLLMQYEFLAFIRREVGQGHWRDQFG